MEETIIWVEVSKERLNELIKSATHAYDCGSCPLYPCHIDGLSCEKSLYFWLVNKK